MLGVITYRTLLWLAGLGPWVLLAHGDDPLRIVEQHVTARFPKLQQTSPAELAALFAGPTADARPVIFDVRTLPEFEVSHIADAIHLDPVTDANLFLSRHGEQIRGRDVVFYCSVGLRSSRLASRLQAAFEACDPASVANLSGGIFRWANDGHKLATRHGETDAVHPYNNFWSRFLRAGR